MSFQLGVTGHKLVHATLLGGYKINQLKRATIGLDSILSELEIRFSNDGLKICQLDDSKAIHVLMQLDSDFFDTFQYDNKENEKVLVLDPSDLKNAVSKAESELSFQVAEKDSETVLRVEILGLITDLHSAQPYEEKTRRPRLTFEVKLRLKADVIKNEIGRLSSGHVLFIVPENEDCLYLRVMEYENETHKKIAKGSGLFTLERYEQEGKKNPSNDSGKKSKHSEALQDRTIKTMYAIKYLNAILKCAVKNQAILMQYAEDKPIELRIGLLQVVMAPRVERR